MLDLFNTKSFLTFTLPLGLDLTGSDLTGSDLTGSDLTGSDLVLTLNSLTSIDSKTFDDITSL